METLRRLFANAWFIGIASIASIASLIFGFYAFSMSRETRELAFFADPATALLVKGGETSKLTVTFDGSPVMSDITVAQVSIWNEGELPIQRENILEPIAIMVGENTPILDATLRTKTRDLTGIVLDTTDLAKGRVGISWKILEQSDGALIQLTYAGPSNRPISLRGVIQRPIKFTTVTEMSLPMLLAATIIIPLLSGWAVSLLLTKFINPAFGGNIVFTACGLILAVVLGLLLPRLVPRPPTPPKALAGAIRAAG